MKHQHPILSRSSLAWPLSRIIIVAVALICVILYVAIVSLTKSKDEHVNNNHNINDRLHVSDDHENEKRDGDDHEKISSPFKRRSGKELSVERERRLQERLKRLSHDHDDVASVEKRRHEYEQRHQNNDNNNPDHLDMKNAKVDRQNNYAKKRQEQNPPVRTDDHHDDENKITTHPEQEDETSTTTPTTASPPPRATTTTTVSSATTTSTTELPPLSTNKKQEASIVPTPKRNSTAVSTRPPPSTTFDRDINRQMEIDARGRQVQRFKPPAPAVVEEVVPGSIPRSWLKEVENGNVNHDSMDEHQLAEKFADVDIIYTWVNGSEMLHRWKKSQVVGKLVNEANSRDRDSDELRHSMRSIFKYMKWHKGRISVVSNGHVPAWMDLSNPRMRVIHQDALSVDEQERFTFNTNSIEQNLWRIPTVSHNFIQFNDDYFVMRDCPPSFFFNEHGGPILLYENGVVNGGMKQVRKMLKDGGKVWISGVFHTHGLMHALLPKEKRQFLKYIKHAPFTYCKSFLQALQTRAFPGVCHRASRNNRFRSHLDVLTPFIHHGFAFAAPDILLSNRSLAKAQNQAIEAAHTEEDRTELTRLFTPLFEKDFKEDLEGDLPTCAPATWKTGHAADSRLVVLKDDVRYNQDAIADAVRGNYQFITLNDGFGNGKLIGKQLFSIIDGWFPNRSEFELGGGYAPEKMPTKKDDNNEKNNKNKKNQTKTLNDEKDLFILHKTLNTGKFGVVLFASSCDGLCSSIRSSDLGFSRLEQRVAPASKQRKTPAPTTTTITTTTTTKAGEADDEDEENHNNTKSSTHHRNKAAAAKFGAAHILIPSKPASLTVDDPIYDLLGETTFYVVPTYTSDHDDDEEDATKNQHKTSEHDEKINNSKNKKLQKKLQKLYKELTTCKCPIGSFTHIDSEEIETVPRIFNIRNDTVHIENDFNYFVKGEKTKFATAFHAERDWRMEVRHPEVLKKVVYRARDEHNNVAHFPADLPLMVLSTVDAVFGEAVSGGHIKETIDHGGDSGVVKTGKGQDADSDDQDEKNQVPAAAVVAHAPVGLLHFAPLPSSVHPKHRKEQLKSDILLLPEHSRLSYLRTYPIPKSRKYEIPLKKFLKFFFMSYRTGTLGFNPNFIRRNEEKQHSTTEVAMKIVTGDKPNNKNNINATQAMTTVEVKTSTTTTVPVTESKEDKKQNNDHGDA